jgi:hypothetical protein
MSGLYRKVATAYWQGELAEANRGDSDSHAVAFYLMTCPSSNQIGAYRLSLATLCDDVGIDSRRALEALRKLSGRGFAVFDERFRMVFVVEAARHEYGERPNLADNRVKNLRKVLPTLLSVCRKSLIWKDFWARYGEPWAEVFEGVDVSPPEALPEPSQSPSEGVLARVQDQDQDQDQDQEIPPEPPQGGSLPAPLSPWYTPGPKGSATAKAEAVLLSELISSPGEIDPQAAKSPKLGDEERMRQERAHWLAAMWWDQANGDGAASESDTVLELWVDWRRARRDRWKSRVKKPADDWRAEVKALRELAGRKRADIVAALGVLAEKGWQGLKWDLIDQELGRAPRGQAREAKFTNPRAAHAGGQRPIDPKTGEPYDDGIRC